MEQKRTKAMSDEDESDRYNRQWKWRRIGKMTEHEK